ncbi:MAG: hypothetical protein Q7R96_05145 [Nanoarchaeota archaeon]|nr:hypothetical protein [Nanoarchaeota archaeon]
MKVLQTLGLTGVLAASLTGCGIEWPRHMTKTGTIDLEYSASITEGKGERQISIQAGKGVEAPHILAFDYQGDVRFDTINLINVPKGHALEKYANLETLETAYQGIKAKPAEKDHNPLNNTVWVLRGK